MRLFCVVLSQVKELHNLDLQRSVNYGSPAGKPRLSFFALIRPHCLDCFVSQCPCTAAAVGGTEGKPHAESVLHDTDE